MLTARSVSVPLMQSEVDSRESLLFKQREHSPVKLGRVAAIDLVLKDVNFDAFINLPDGNCKTLCEKNIFFFFSSAHPLLKTRSLL